jgi:hypothetical protein
VIALDEEIGSAMMIGELSWHRTSVGAESATFSNFNIYLGHGANDELGTVFDDNYIEGTKTLVYSAPSQTVHAEAEGWFDLSLDTPFEYNGTDNLIMEIQWAGGSGTFYTYKWATGTSRCLTAANPSLPSGTLSTSMCQFGIDAVLSLRPVTFGAIKSFFAQ